MPTTTTTRARPRTHDHHSAHHRAGHYRAPGSAPAPDPGLGTEPGGLDPAPSDGPQSQGDVIVLPWETFMSPHIRHEWPAPP